MTHPLLNLLAALSLLAQAVLGPAAPGVVLCVSLGGCGADAESASSAAAPPVRNACCTSCNAGRAESAPVGVMPRIALSIPCGDHCGDCVDIELHGDATLPARVATIDATWRSIVVELSFAHAASVAAITAISVPGPAPGRPPCGALTGVDGCLHAPIVRAVRLRL